MVTNGWPAQPPSLFACYTVTDGACSHVILFSGCLLACATGFEAAADRQTTGYAALLVLVSGAPR